MSAIERREERRLLSAASAGVWAAAAWLVLWLLGMAWLAQADALAVRWGEPLARAVEAMGRPLRVPVPALSPRAQALPGLWAFSGWASVLAAMLAVPAGVALASLVQVRRGARWLRAQGLGQEARALAGFARIMGGSLLAWMLLPLAVAATPGAPGTLLGWLAGWGFPAFSAAAGALALPWALLLLAAVRASVRLRRALAGRLAFPEVRRQEPPGAAARAEPRAGMAALGPAPSEAEAALGEAGAAPESPPPPRGAAPAAPAAAAAAGRPLLRIPSRLGWLSQRRAVVAVDLGHGAVKVLQAVRAGPRVGVAAAGRFWVSPDVYRRGQVRDPEALARELKANLQRLRIASRRAVMAMGGEASILRTVAFPRMTEEELREALRWEADKFFPFRYEEAVVDFRLLDLSVRQLWPEGRAGEGQVPVLLGACRRDAVVPVVTAADQAGLELVELEPHPLAAFRALAYAGGSGRAAGVVALVELGLEGGYITIFRHGAPLLHRPLLRGVFPRDARAALASDPEAPLPLPDPRETEAVAGETARSLEVAVVQLRPPRLRVVLTGDGAVFPEVEEALRRHLEELLAGHRVLEEPPAVERLAWEREAGWALPPDPALAAEGAAWAGALGMALRGLGVTVPRPPVLDGVEPALAGAREGEGAA